MPGGLTFKGFALLLFLASTLVSAQSIDCPPAVRQTEAVFPRTATTFTWTCTVASLTPTGITFPVVGDISSVSILDATGTTSKAGKNWFVTALLSDLSGSVATFSLKLQGDVPQFAESTSSDIVEESSEVSSGTLSSYPDFTVSVSADFEVEFVSSSYNGVLDETEFTYRYRIGLIPEVQDIFVPVAPDGALLAGSTTTAGATVELTGGNNSPLGLRLAQTAPLHALEGWRQYSVTFPGQCPESVSSGVIAGVVESDDTTKYYSDELTLTIALIPVQPATTFSNLWDDPDLPGAIQRYHEFRAGSLIIPMSDALQPGDGAPYTFNFKTYGLLADLLWADVHLRWLVRVDKSSMSEADFSATVFPVHPQSLNKIDASVAFTTGAFAVDARNASAALDVIAAFDVSHPGNGVVIYSLRDRQVLPVKVEVTHRPYAALMDNNGGSIASVIHGVIFEESGMPEGTKWVEISAAEAQNLGPTNCFTFSSEPHYVSTDNLVATRVQRFMDSGGNFVAQCEGVRTFEEYDNYAGTQDDYFASNSTIIQLKAGIAETVRHNPDSLVMQFDGLFDGSHGGSLPDWAYQTSSALSRSTYDAVTNTNQDWKIAVAGKSRPTGNGGNWMFLGSHSYSGNTAGLRIYMNNFFIPATPKFCPHLKHGGPDPPPVVDPEPEGCLDPDITNVYERSGYLYATLDNVAWNNSGVAGCQTSWIRMPPAWQFAPNTFEHRAVAAELWATNVLVMEDGVGYDKDLNVSGVYMRTTQGYCHKVSSCEARILLYREKPGSKDCIVNSDFEALSFVGATAPIVEWQHYPSSGYSADGSCAHSGAMGVSATDGGTYQRLYPGDLCDGLTEGFKVSAWSKHPLAAAPSGNPIDYRLEVLIQYDSGVNETFWVCFEQDNAAWHSRELSAYLDPLLVLQYVDINLVIADGSGAAVCFDHVQIAPLPASALINGNLEETRTGDGVTGWTNIGDGLTVNDQATGMNGCSSRCGSSSLNGLFQAVDVSGARPGSTFVVSARSMATAEMAATSQSEYRLLCQLHYDDGTNDVAYYVEWEHTPHSWEQVQVVLTPDTSKRVSSLEITLIASAITFSGSGRVCFEDVTLDVYEPEDPVPPIDPPTPKPECAVFDYCGECAGDNSSCTPTSADLTIDVTSVAPEAPATNTGSYRVGDTVSLALNEVLQSGLLYNFQVSILLPPCSMLVGITTPPTPNSGDVILGNLLSSPSVHDNGTLTWSYDLVTVSMDPAGSPEIDIVIDIKILDEPCVSSALETMNPEGSSTWTYLDGSTAATLQDQTVYEIAQPTVTISYCQLNPVPTDRVPAGSPLQWQVDILTGARATAFDTVLVVEVPVGFRQTDLSLDGTSGDFALVDSLQTAVGTGLGTISIVFPTLAPGATYSVFFNGGLDADADTVFPPGTVFTSTATVTDYWGRDVVQRRHYEPTLVLELQMGQACSWYDFCLVCDGSNSTCTPSSAGLSEVVTSTGSSPPDHHIGDLATLETAVDLVHGIYHGAVLTMTLPPCTSFQRIVSGPTPASSFTQLVNEAYTDGGSVQTWTWDTVEQSTTGANDDILVEIEVMILDEECFPGVATQTLESTAQFTWNFQSGVAAAPVTSSASLTVAQPVVDITAFAFVPVPSPAYSGTPLRFQVDVESSGVTDGYNANLRVELPTGLQTAGLTLDAAAGDGGIVSNANYLSGVWSGVIPLASTPGTRTFFFDGAVDANAAVTHGNGPFVSLATVTSYYSHATSVSAREYRPVTVLSLPLEVECLADFCGVCDGDNSQCTPTTGGIELTVTSTAPAGTKTPRGTYRVGDSVTLRSVVDLQHGLIAELGLSVTLPVCSRLVRVVSGPEPVSEATTFFSVSTNPLAGSTGTLSWTIGDVQQSGEGFSLTSDGDGDIAVVIETELIPDCITLSEEILAASTSSSWTTSDLVTLIGPFTDSAEYVYGQPSVRISFYQFNPMPTDRVLPGGALRWQVDVISEGPVPAYDSLVYVQKPDGFHETPLTVDSTEGNAVALMGDTLSMPGNFTATFPFLKNGLTFTFYLNGALDSTIMERYTDGHIFTSTARVTDFYSRATPDRKHYQPTLVLPLEMGAACAYFDFCLKCEGDNSTCVPDSGALDLQITSTAPNGAKSPSGTYRVGDDVKIVALIDLSHGVLYDLKLTVTIPPCTTLKSIVRQPEAGSSATDLGALQSSPNLGATGALTWTLTGATQNGGGNAVPLAGDVEVEILLTVIEECTIPQPIPGVATWNDVAGVQKGLFVDSVSFEVDVPNVFISRFEFVPEPNPANSGSQLRYEVDVTCGGQSAVDAYDVAVSVATPVGLQDQLLTLAAPNSLLGATSSGVGFWNAQIPHCVSGQVITVALLGAVDGDTAVVHGNGPFVSEASVDEFFSLPEGHENAAERLEFYPTTVLELPLTVGCIFDFCGVCQGDGSTCTPSDGTVQLDVTSTALAGQKTTTSSYRVGDRVRLKTTAGLQRGFSYQYSIALSLGSCMEYISTTQGPVALHNDVEYGAITASPLPGATGTLVWTFDYVLQNLETPPLDGDLIVEVEVFVVDDTCLPGTPSVSHTPSVQTTWTDVSTEASYGPLVDSANYNIGQPSVFISGFLLNPQPAGTVTNSDSLRYQVDVTSNGPVTAYEVAVQVIVPNGLQDQPLTLGSEGNGAGMITSSSYSSDPTVGGVFDVLFSQIQPGQTYTFFVVGAVNDDATAEFGSPYTFQADATVTEYFSLPLSSNNWQDRRTYTPTDVLSLSIGIGCSFDFCSTCNGDNSTCTPNVAVISTQVVDPKPFYPVGDKVTVRTQVDLSHGLFYNFALEITIPTCAVLQSVVSGPSPGSGTTEFWSLSSTQQDPSQGVFTWTWGGVTQTTGGNQLPTSGDVNVVYELQIVDGDCIDGSSGQLKFPEAEAFWNNQANTSVYSVTDSTEYPIGHPLVQITAFEFSPVPNPAHSGSDLRFRVDVSSAGDLTAYDVDVTVVLPSGLRDATLVVVDGLGNGQPLIVQTGWNGVETLQVTFSSLSPGVVYTFFVDGAVDADAAVVYGNGPYTSEARVVRYFSLASTHPLFAGRVEYTPIETLYLDLSVECVFDFCGVCDGDESSSSCTPTTADIELDVVSLAPAGEQSNYNAYRIGDVVDLELVVGLFHGLHYDVLIGVDLPSCISLVDVIGGPSATDQAGVQLGSLLSSPSPGTTGTVEWAYSNIRVDGDYPAQAGGAVTVTLRVQLEESLCSQIPVVESAAPGVLYPFSPSASLQWSNLQLVGRRAVNLASDSTQFFYTQPRVAVTTYAWDPSLVSVQPLDAYRQRVEVTTSGVAPAYDVEVSIQLPTGMFAAFAELGFGSAVPFIDVFTQTGGDITVTFPVLEPGQTLSFYIVGIVDADVSANTDLISNVRIQEYYSLPSAHPQTAYRRRYTPPETLYLTVSTLPAGCGADIQVTAFDVWPQNVRRGDYYTVYANVVVPVEAPVVKLSWTNTYGETGRVLSRRASGVSQSAQQWEAEIYWAQRAVAEGSTSRSFTLVSEDDLTICPHDSPTQDIRCDAIKYIAPPLRPLYSHPVMDENYVPVDTLTLSTASPNPVPGALAQLGDESP